MPLATSDPGIESLLLLVRESPLTTTENATLQAIFTGLKPAKLKNVAGKVAWFENGEMVKADFDPLRGPKLEAGDQSGDVMLQIQGKLKTELKGLFPLTRGICFGNEAR